MIGLSDFSWYRGNLSWLRRRTIFLTKSGSHAYGTNLPTSDLDIKGVAIPPREFFLGFLHRFEQAEARDPVDATVYDVRKFVSLAADCNPNIIEILYSDPADAIVVAPEWERLAEARERFLSRKAQHTFSGYAMAQLKRIKTHRRWLLNPPARKPLRTDFGLPEQSTIEKEQLGVIEAKIRKVEDTLGGEGWTKDKVEERDAELVTEVARTVDLSPNLIPIIIAERRYGSAMRNWVAYEKWKAERNAVRSKLEADFGYDTKHAMHLVRLMRMAVEILERGEVLVKRPDAEELLAIRRGAWTYDALMTWAEAQEARLPEIAARSPLPHAPDRNAIDAIVVSIVESALARDALLPV